MTSFPFKNVIISLIFSALENKLITKICDNESEVYTREYNILSPSPSLKPEIARKDVNSQLPNMVTSEADMLPTEGISYPVSKEVTVVKCF